MTSKQLREKRGNLAEQAKAILDKAGAENRDLSAEEQTSFDKIHADIERLGKDVERIERQERIDVEMAASRGRATSEDRRVSGDGREVAADPAKEIEQRKREHSEAFEAYLRNGEQRITPEQRAILERETRAQSLTDAAGGYTVAPAFSGMLEESLKEYGGMREVASTFQSATGHDLEWPTVDDTAQKGVILAENTAAAEQDFTFGQILFKAYKYSSKMVKVSSELLQDSAFDLPSYLARALGERIARILNEHFTTGTNTAQPQGVVTGASSAVTAAAQTVVTYEELLDLIHAIDPAYRRQGARFMFNDKTLKVLKKLKDGQGRPMWQPGFAEREPDTLLGYPYTVNQDVADLASASKSILFGAFKKYMIRDVRGITVLRLNERFADAHQVGFLAFSRHDGRILDAGTDPIKFITQAT